MSWRAGDEAPTDLYRTVDGRLAEAVVMDDPHDLLVERGQPLTTEVAALGRQYEAGEQIEPDPPTETITTEGAPQ